MRLKGKTALVTGGGRRLGREIALALADNGADIILHFLHSRIEAEEVSLKIQSMGRNCLISSHNLTESENTGKWFAKLIRNQGCPNILVNSASDYSTDKYVTMKDEDLLKSINMHVYSPLVLIRMMYESGVKGSVVNMLDTRAVDRDPSHASYHLGKRGLLTITRDLAMEFAPELRINAVAPGIILSPDGEGEEWLERMKSTNPLKENGTAKDICDAVLFLVAAQFTTGQIIFVDGGRHLKGNAYGI